MDKNIDDILKIVADKYNVDEKEVYEEIEKAVEMAFESNKNKINDIFDNRKVDIYEFIKVISVNVGEDEDLI